MGKEYVAMAHEDPWKNAVEATDDEDDADFYFTAPSEKLPPRAVGNAPLNTPDTSFQNFDDSNSLDTTPKVGRSTLKAANQTNPPALEPMFEPSFPSEEFLSVVSQQVQQHSFSPLTDGVHLKTLVEGDGFESPSLESLTLNPFPAGLPQDGDSFTTASQSQSFASGLNVEGHVQTTVTSPTQSGSPSALNRSHHDSATESSFYDSPLQTWTEMTKWALANVMASESIEQNVDDVQKPENGNDLTPKIPANKFEAMFTPDSKRLQASSGRANLFSRDLIAAEFDPDNIAGEEVRHTPETPSPPSKRTRSGLNSLLAGGDDEDVPQLESSFLSQQSNASAPSPNKSRAGLFLSHVVGRCYTCDDGQVSMADDHALFQQWQDTKHKSLSVFQNAVQFISALLDEKPFASASKRDDDRFSTARRHRRFPSASTYDYSESQNFASGEMSHCTASEGDATSFDDDYYDDDEEDGDEDDEEDDDERTRSTARGESSVDAGREEAAAAPVLRSRDFYSPRVSENPPATAAGRRHNGRYDKKTPASRAGSDAPSISSSLWKSDPLVKVNEGVQKLFGDAGLVFTHQSEKLHGSAVLELQAPGQPKKSVQLARATDRFAC